MVHHNRYNNQSIGWKRKKEKEREIGFIYREGVFWTAKENFLLNKFGCYVDITTLVMVGLTVAEKYKFSLKKQSKKKTDVSSGVLLQELEQKNVVTLTMEGFSS